MSEKKRMRMNNKRRMRMSNKRRTKGLIMSKPKKRMRRIKGVRRMGRRMG